MQQINSNKQFAKALAKYPEFVEELRKGKDPEEALNEAGIRIGSPLDTDKVIYRIVVSALGMAVIIAVTGSIYLAANLITDTPEILVAIGSAAVGALAGLLAPSPGKA